LLKGQYLYFMERNGVACFFMLKDRTGASVAVISEMLYIARRSTFYELYRNLLRDSGIFHFVIFHSFKYLLVLLYSSVGILFVFVACQLNAKCRLRSAEKNRQRRAILDRIILKLYISTFGL